MNQGASIHQLQILKHTRVYQVGVEKPIAVTLGATVFV
jgi:hypothetical protein